MKFSPQLVLISIVALSCYACSSDKVVTPDPVQHRLVSGKVTSTTPTPATAGVVVKLGTRTVTTDASSRYEFDSVSDGSYTVTPELTGRTFTPPDRPVVVAGANVNNVDFVLDDVPSVADDSIHMVRIQAGTFMMGSNASDAFKDPKAVPKHQVTITRSFLIGKYEVTQLQWKRVMFSNPSTFVGDDLPVLAVTFDSAAIFCNRMSVLHGFESVYSGSGRETIVNMSANGYRLPTEAEWEFAAAGGDTTIVPGLPEFIVGDDLDEWNNLLHTVAWWLGYPPNPAPEPHPPGQKLPNAYGLYDMVGNAYEMMTDDRFDVVEEPTVDPACLPLSIFGRTLTRGGSYNRGAGQANIRNRQMALDIGQTEPTVGIRIIRYAP